MSFQSPITIAKAIKEIEINNYLLPAIQREFVWSHEKIEWLFDSLMRNYPISSFLFWEVKEKITKDYKFYKFISEYRERYKTHNDEISTDRLSSFKAILDGQQRLTSLNIGLKGSYAYRRPRLWEENTERVYPTRDFYLNIENELKDQEDGRIYEFKFIEREKTNKDKLYDEKWFRVGCILEHQDAEKFDNYLDDNFDNKFTRKSLRALRMTIHDKPIINFFLEEEQDIDKALNIFIRVNSGGEPLSFSDLLLSIAVANWEKKDARKSIHELVDNIWDKGFTISKDFVLKTFLYLHSKDIKFKVTNFSKENAKDFELEWEKIRDVILSTFDLVKTFGFTDYTLVSKNSLIPIIYYLYHSSIYQQFHTKSEYKNDREKIERWLHVSLLKRIFGGQSDNTLTQIRRAFTGNVTELPVKDELQYFPAEDINSNIKRDTSIGDEFIEELLKTQKDDQYAFSILALLYPNLDYKNNNFHKDHLHPAAKYDKLSDSNTCKQEWITYNSVLNLQMLDANENMSKQDIDLEDWVELQTQSQDRAKFLKNHLIPNINLKLTEFENFVEKRKELLMKKLRTILS
ncbi:MAG: DUF262 domain-containing protein [Candidatus Roizmanbacteria bacterium]|nr:DUF262 domain-containing protein [Candidatus Roizmanbacteria bacterium]